jgi:thymidylate synthase
MQQYLDLLNTIQEKGTYKPAARENLPGTMSYFGYQFRHDLSTGFPALTTKKLYWKGVTSELLWFLRGDTNIKFLDERGVTKMWHEDAYNYYVTNFNACAREIPDYMATRHLFSFEEFCREIKINPEFGDCGYQYGKVWRAWDDSKSYDPGDVTIDQIVNAINRLIKSPESRRHVTTAWDPSHDTDLALTWCHVLFQFNCRPIAVEQRFPLMDRLARAGYNAQDIVSVSEWMDQRNIPKYYLDCQLYQRSADMILGVPLNIASYALLTHIMAKICNMIPGEFIHTFGDAHIYDNHKEAVAEQLLRSPRKLPELEFSTNFYAELQAMWAHCYDGVLSSEEFTEFIDGLDYYDFTLKDYDPHPKIDAELSTGMKK